MDQAQKVVVSRALGCLRAVMSAAAPSAAESPVLPMHFQKGGTRLEMFTTIATLGTPQDITLQELRIESFFPMDHETRAVFRKWGASTRKKRPLSQRPRSRSGEAYDSAPHARWMRRPASSRRFVAVA
jgi:hypothetical protein